MRTLDQIMRTQGLIDELKDRGDFEGARELFEQFVMDALIFISCTLSGRYGDERILNETETK